MDLSIVVPIYNVESYLLSCLDSINQNIGDIDAEVLLIDDGSTDSSSQIAEEYAANHGSFRYFRKDNGGLGNARNYGAERAQAEYLMFVDSDDLLVKGILPRMMKVAQRTRTDLIACDMCRMRGQSVVSSPLHVFAFSGLPDNVTHVTKHPDLVYDSAICNKLIKRSFYKSTGITFPVGYLYEDQCVTVPLHYLANSVSIVRATGYLWTIRTSGDLSISQRFTEMKSLVDKVSMTDRLFAFLDEHDVEEEFRQAVEKKVLRLHFGGFIKRLHQLEEETALQCVELMGASLERTIRPSSIELVQTKYQQIAYDLIARDLHHLLRVNNYNEQSYNNTWVKREDDSLVIDVPKDLFTKASCDYQKDIIGVVPFCNIDTIRKEEEIVVLVGHLYHPRVSVNNPSQQQISAFLVNDETGAKVPLTCSSCLLDETAKLKEDLVSHEDYRLHHYDYSGTGFQLVFDFSSFDAIDGIEGDNFVLLEYKNCFVSGTRLLRGISIQAKKSLKGLAQRTERYLSHLETDIRDTLIVRLEQLKDTSDSGEDLPKSKETSQVNERIGKQSEDELSVDLRIPLSQTLVHPIPPQPFTGAAIKPSVRLVYEGQELAVWKDYSPAYFNNTSKGMATIVLTGRGKYIGSATVGFAIK